MTERRLEISPDLNVARTLDRARTLAARAVKKGLSGGYTVRIEDGEPRPEYKVDNFGFRKPTGRMETPRYLIIDGTPVAFNGWNFVAIAEWENGLPIVNGSPDYEGPQVDRDALVEGYCDYCKTARRRSKVVIVENEAGERRAVGTSCVKDFLGAEVTASWYSGKDAFEEFGGYTGGGRFDDPLEWTLTLAATVIRQAGFVPASSYDKQPTRADVNALLGYASLKMIAEVEEKYGEPTDEDRQVAKDALEFGRTMEGESDYALNVRAVFASDGPLGPVYEAKRLGLVVSVVGVMLKQRGELAERKVKANFEDGIIEALYAEAGTKVEFAEAFVGRIFTFETQWGWSRAITFYAGGYRFKWLTSAGPDLDEGDRVSIKGTVKGLDEYDGKTSTALLRVKVTQLAEVAA